MILRCAVSATLSGPSLHARLVFECRMTEFFSFNQLCDAYGVANVIDVLAGTPLEGNARVEGYSIFLVRQAFAAQETLWRGPIDQIFV